MNKERKIREAGKAANRLVFSRSVKLMIVFGIVIFIPLIWQLYQLQIVQHDELEEMAVTQQTSQLSVSASRGTIYDANGNVLAISSTVYDVIISPKAIDEKQQSLDESLASAKEKGTDTSDYDWNVEDVVCAQLAEILDLDEEELHEKCQDTTSQYKRLATKVESDVEDQVRALIDEYDLTGCVYLQPNTKRYYPYGDMAAQIIGFTNADGDGAYGLEAKYNDELSGTPGYIVTAVDEDGTDLLNFFQDYYDAEDGSDIYLTLDANIQEYCESLLEEYCEKYETTNGGTIIVMECDTGAILGMASSPGFDLNNYSTIEDEDLLDEVEENAQTLVEESEAEVAAAIAEAEKEGLTLTDEETTVLDYDSAYSQTYSEMLYSLWTNKAITDTYEPGSTFKALVLAAALEEGVVDENSTFYCAGSTELDIYTIGCSATHGTQTLAEAIGHSCNMALLDIGQRLGYSTFYQYFYNFGIMETTGIDLPYENIGEVWSYEDFNITELATASFGQRFEVTPIQMITAFNAVVNGGYLYTPYVVDKIVDSDGNTTYEAEATAVRQVVSEETSQTCAEILEGVVSKYAGKNAYQAGYRIGGKTGTSQTLVDGENIVSFMGFAPADDPDVIVLVIFDRPLAVDGGDYTSSGLYISGGNMAAPVAGKLLAKVLDYRGYEKSYSSDDLTGELTSVPDLTGQTEAQAEQTLNNKKLSYRVVGSGDTVTGQIPSSGTYIPQNSTVILYMGEEVPTDEVEMPNLKGLTPDQVVDVLNDLGLYMQATGTSGYYTSTTVCTSQSISAGTSVKRGTLLTVEFEDTDTSDADASTGLDGD
ncbi:MAG: PASTA domain-containing protein [Clostridiales bacterium]|nr:PASTA domain-containing protein [Clostridiales bacterium]